MRRRRRDLLVDATVAVVLTAVVMIATSGLGVVAIVDAVAALALVSSLLLEHGFARPPRSGPRTGLGPGHSRR